MNSFVRNSLIIAASVTLLLGCQPPCKYQHEFESVQMMVDDAKTRIAEITPEDLNEMMQNEEFYILVDVRSQNEHDMGYIPGSVLISRGRLEFRIDNESFWEEEGMYLPEKEDVLVIYCRSGKRSALAADILMRMGYKNVRSLENGWSGWKETFPDLHEKNIAPVTSPIPHGGASEEAESDSC